MAGASDKARFYLEQSVPELRELERKEIFNKEELRAIAAKRSDFEHILNARGSQPSDYARYAEYEMNLEALRRKRVKRKGVKTTAHTGQRRIFFVLDRATKKFHGDVGLWMQYIEYARKQKANKKIQRVLTDVLRMHPTRAELWIYAARYAMDVQLDIDSARSYMQRGLRFCTGSKSMYLEYARLEMSYIAKVAKRREVLGIGSVKSRPVEELSGSQHNHDADMIALPSFGAGDARQDASDEHRLDDLPLKDPVTTSAMNGAIPLAIFDAAMKQFSIDANIGEAFFDMFADFFELPSTRHILQHVVEVISSTDPLCPAAVSCRCRLFLLGIPLDSPEFPAAVGAMVKTLRSCLQKVSATHKPELCGKVLSWLSPLADDEVLGPELKQVLAATERQLRRGWVDGQGSSRDH